MVIYSVVASVMMANMMVNDQEHTNQDDSYSRSRSALNFDSDGPIFSLYDGTVRGTVDNSTGALQFFGLPYADPPTGSNRFRPPIVSFLCKNDRLYQYWLISGLRVFELSTDPCRSVARSTCISG